MDQRHRADTIADVSQHRMHPLVGQSVGLQADQTGYDLEVIFYPVMDFPQQHLFFCQRRTYLLLGLLALSDVKAGADGILQYTVLHDGRVGPTDQAACTVFADPVILEAVRKISGPQLFPGQTDALHVIVRHKDFPEDTSLHLGYGIPRCCQAGLIKALDATLPVKNHDQGAGCIQYGLVELFTGP